MKLIFGRGLCLTMIIQSRFQTEFWWTTIFLSYQWLGNLWRFSSSEFYRTRKWMQRTVWLWCMELQQGFGFITRTSCCFIQFWAEISGHTCHYKHLTNACKPFLEYDSTYRYSIRKRRYLWEDWSSCRSRLFRIGFLKRFRMKIFLTEWIVTIRRI